MKLLFAAPWSGFPSLPIALISHESLLHFFTKLIFAAPASYLPSLPIALLSQLACAIADPTANVITKAARNSLFMLRTPATGWASQPNDEV